MRVAGIAAAAAFVGLVVVACAAPATADEIRIHVQNQTTIPVGVYVDGDWRGTDEPGATIVVPLGDGVPPIRVEARSPSGATLVTLEAPAGPIESMRDGDDSEVVGEAFGLPCGVITIVIGDQPPGQTVAPAPSVEPGPCP